MFRKMLRFKQEISREECIEILETQPRGVLSVAGDDGYPYGMPINQWYCREDGHFYFHGGKSGHRIDAVKNNDKVSFCVYDQGYRKEGEWALNIKSVIVFGRMRVVEDHERAMDICRKLSYKFTRDEDYIDREVQRSGPGTLVLELVPEHMTGKLVNEA
ncbi:MAG: pyridoxamine 5'-phosphate oxidase family protein [Oscillospiraceae bacterium]|nr:pyridoxamine 5'-phosphate oxidase family protein [Oscillospiraceae bacterium]